MSRDSSSELPIDKFDKVSGNRVFSELEPTVDIIVRDVRTVDYNSLQIPSAASGR